MLEAAEADELLASVVLTDEGRQNPYVAYGRFREELPRWESSFGPTVLTTYDDSMEVLRHPKLGRRESDMPATTTVGGRRLRSSEDSAAMLFLNPPDHTRIRGLVARTFTARRVAELRPRLTELAEPMLDRLATEGGGDVMTTLAVPFPVAVISELLGVPSDESTAIEPYVHASARLIDAAADEETITRGEAASMRLAEYFVELADRKRRQPDDGLFSALIGLESEGDRLGTEELISNTILLYVAGFETTSNLIGNGLRLLLTHPDQMQLLRSRPDLIESAVWEMLRHDSPVQLNGRSVLEDAEVSGTRRRRGESFLILQGSGNHDASVYDRPDRFDITRFADGGGVGEREGSGSKAAAPPPPPLSFGWGPHRCLGAQLARTEGEIVFSEMLHRFTDIVLDHDALGGPGSTPRYGQAFTLRGLQSLPVHVE